MPASGLELHSPSPALMPMPQLLGHPGISSAAGSAQATPQLPFGDITALELAALYDWASSVETLKVPNTAVDPAEAPDAVRPPVSGPFQVLELQMDASLQGDQMVADGTGAGQARWALRPPLAFDGPEAEPAPEPASPHGGPEGAL